MSLTANIYAITANAYASAIGGDSDRLLISATVREVDLDKAWHAVHYLLTGNSTLTFLLSGIQLQGMAEHCEAHSPGAIKTLHDRLSRSSVEQLMLGFDAVKFNEANIYPGGWDISATRYVEERLSKFLMMLKRVADGNFGLLVVIV